MSVNKQVVIGGISVNVFSEQNTTNGDAPVAVLFFLHGREGSAQDADWVAETILRSIQEQRLKSGTNGHDLLVVTLDQRNHGTRLVDTHLNSAWSEREPEMNDRYIVDNYAIPMGTCRDISFVIDFLPSYLYPSGERDITQWICAGFSLGGRATWYVLRHEPRVQVGVPICAYADYISMLTGRADKNRIPFEPPYVPNTLLDLILHTDSAAAQHEVANASNPYLGKKILVMVGEADTAVPFSASKKFVDDLNVGEQGDKRVHVWPNVQHECTPEMVQMMSEYIWEVSLSAL